MTVSARMSDEESTNPEEDEDEERPASKRREMFRVGSPSCTRGGERARSFLMVFMGHSGSSAIMSELRQHPEIYIENPEAVDHGENEFNSPNALNFTRAFFSRGQNQNQVPGFKIRPWHLVNAPEEWAALAREFDTRIIWQYRRNALKQTVGEYSYRALNDSSVLEGLRSRDELQRRCEIGAGCSFPIEDLDYFHSMLRNSMMTDAQIARATSLLADGSDCVHELRYEDYLYHRKGTMLDLYDFLGIKHIDIEPTRFKATGDNMCKVVDNWLDLCAAFYGCAAWRPLFEDPINGCGCPFSKSPTKYCDASPSYLIR